jgi:hypothetical protein
MQFKGIEREELSASVEQVARVLSIPSADLRSEIGAATSVRDWLADSQVRELLRDAPPRRPIVEAERIVAGAFEQAQGTQKAEWREMTLPVLKNRMITVADGDFDEVDFGCPNLRYFVNEFPELLHVTPSRPHWTVRFLGAEPTAPNVAPKPPAATATARGRVRPDIWTASVDYRSGQTYVWLLDDKVAEAGEPGDRALRFPTLSQRDIADWRAQFAVNMKDDDRDDAIEKWLRVGGTSTMLAPGLRNEWNGYLRHQVQTHAERFFVEADLEAPPDLIINAGGRTTGMPAVAVDLRAALHLVIDQLPDRDLRQILVPATALISRAGR